MRDSVGSGRAQAMLNVVKTRHSNLLIHDSLVGSSQLYSRASHRGTLLQPGKPTAMTQALDPRNQRVLDNGPSVYYTDWRAWFSPILLLSFVIGPVLVQLLRTDYPAQLLFHAPGLLLRQTFPWVTLPVLLLLALVLYVARRNVRKLRRGRILHGSIVSVEQSGTYRFRGATRNYVKLRLDFGADAPPLPQELVLEVTPEISSKLQVNGAISVLYASPDTYVFL